MLLLVSLFGVFNVATDPYVLCCYVALCSVLCLYVCLNQKIELLSKIDEVVVVKEVSIGSEMW